MSVNNRVLPKWRIYYDKGTFDSTQGKPKDAPSRGLICIPQLDDLVNRVIMHGWDWYYWVESEQQWWGSDRDGLIDRILSRLEIDAICQGRNVSNKDFAEIFGRADKDLDFPLQGGHRYGESPHGPRRAQGLGEVV